MQSRAVVTSWPVRLLMVVSGASLGSACGHRDGGHAPVATSESKKQTYGFGYDPAPNPHVKYRSDTIVVGGGPESIRSASSDGTVWIIDGRAPNAQQLRPGKVMLATSRATGRILSVDHVGDDLAVTLGPTQLGDILQEADIHIEADLNPTSMTYQVVPDLPDMYRDLSAPKSAPKPTARLQSQPGTSEMISPLTLSGLLLIQTASATVSTSDQPNGYFPYATKTAPRFTANGWEFEPSYKKDTPKDATPGASVRERIGLKIAKRAGGLKAGIDVGLWVRDLKIKSHIVYRDGKMDKDSLTMVVDGLDGLDLDISSGIEKAYGDNQKVRFEVPIEIIQGLPPVDGIPFVLQIKFRVLIETALGGNNASLSAASKYSLSGPLGISNGAVLTPTTNETSSLMDAVKGISLGVSGYVFAVETRFLFGVGTPAWFAGPYAKLTTSIGITKAADVSVGMMPICRSGVAKFDGGVGMGAQLQLPEIASLKKLLGDGAKTEWEVIDVSNTFYRKDFYTPQIQACKI